MTHLTDLLTEMLGYANKNSLDKVNDLLPEILSEIKYSPKKTMMAAAVAEARASHIGSRRPVNSPLTFQKTTGFF